MQWFMQIVQRVGFENHERLREELAKAESETLRWIRRNQKKEERRSAAALKQLVTREPHRTLQIEVPPAINKMHAQAVIAYGFSRIGSGVLFAGAHALHEEGVRHNVTAKLKQIGLASLDLEAFRNVLIFLKQSGVVSEHSGKRGALSLNLDEGAAQVTDQGRRIIVAMKRFFHQKTRR